MLPIPRRCADGLPTERRSCEASGVKEGVKTYLQLQAMLRCGPGCQDLYAVVLRCVLRAERQRRRPGEILERPTTTERPTMTMGSGNRRPLPTPKQ